jgi:PAS domain S-box-containing protein
MPFPAEECAGLQVLKQGKVLVGHEDCFIRKDGTFFDVVYSSAPLRTAKEISGLVVVFRDVSERKQAAEALRTSEARFRAIADNIPQLAWMAEPGTEGQVTWFNKAWLDYTGTTMEQNQGSGWQTVHHPDHAARVIAKFEDHVRKSLDWEDTFPLRGRDGEFRWFLSRMNVIRDASGKPVRIFGTNTDVTELRALEEELRGSEAQSRMLFETAEAATRAKDGFLAALSHELRTPLNPALLLATSLADDAELPPRARSDIDVIAKSIALQTQLIDDMLDVTRITTGKLRLDLQPIDAHEVLRQVYEILRADMQARQIELNFDLAASNNRVKADAVRLQHIFWNLLKNAGKFTSPGGAVNVRTRNPADNEGVLEVEIADTGIGIEPAMLEKVFDAFSQEEHHGTHRFGGLGLGLAITRSLVEAQNGMIRAESAGRNRGTTFQIQLPLAVPELSEAVETATVNPAASVPTVRRILLVEDHEQTRLTLIHLLERRGHKVAGVTTALAARKIAAARDCDLVISDLGLPDGDGHTLMTDLRDNYGLPGIALSGYGTEEDLERSRKSGFFTHLTKPVDIRVLEAAIAAAPQNTRRISAP